MPASPLKATPEIRLPLDPRTAFAKVFPKHAPDEWVQERSDVRMGIKIASEFMRKECLRAFAIMPLVERCYGYMRAERTLPVTAR